MQASVLRGGNASLAWSKPLNVGQNSLALAQVLKVNGFDS